MASRTSRIETVDDEFDDDFDLPLPNRPVPAAGATPHLPSGGSNFAAPVPFSIPGGAGQGITDRTPFKSWTCVYPIYIDAKWSYGTGRRRTSREKSCWWPNSQLIATAAVRLQLKSFHEADKTHPRDWENPGRVKIQIKDDNGRYLNRNITTKKQLLEAIAVTIQRLDASQTPLPEQIQQPARRDVLTPIPVHNSADAGRARAPSPAPSKKKGTTAPGPGPTSSKSQSQSQTQTQSYKPPRARPTRLRTPQPPTPLPPLSSRYNPNSPLLEAGVLVETVKVALKQQEKAAAEEKEKEKSNAQIGAAGGSGGLGGGKGGKRKVVRVRG